MPLASSLRIRIEPESSSPNHAIYRSQKNRGISEKNVKSSGVMQCNRFFSLSYILYIYFLFLFLFSHDMKIDRYFKDFFFVFNKFIFNESMFQFIFLPYKQGFLVSLFIDKESFLLVLLSALVIAIVAITSQVKNYLLK